MSLSQTRSSFSQSSRVKIGVNFTSEQKASVALKKTEFSGFSDNHASGAKFTYRYNDNEGRLYSIFLSKDDEAYFYESVSGGFQFGFDLTANTKMNFGVHVASKSYSSGESETLIQRTLSVGVDHEILDGLLLGLSYSKENYLGRGTQTQRYLRGLSVNSADIGSYIDLQIEDSLSAYLELAFDRWVIGLNGSVDRYLTSSSRAITADVYLDISVDPSWNLGGFVSRGTTDVSSALTNSAGLSLTYRY